MDCGLQEELTLYEELKEFLLYELLIAWLEVRLYELDIEVIALSELILIELEIE